MDFEILRQAGMTHQVRECGGLGGLSYALRTISLALDVAEDMEALCPNALLLDVTNPMPRVVTAVHQFTAISAYGFCNASQEGAQGYEWLAGLVKRRHDAIDAVTAGLNHFTWVLALRDRETGENLYPALEEAVRRDHGHGADLRRRWLDQYGAIAAVGPGHAKDFLAPDPAIHYGTRPPFHGDAQERMHRIALLKAIAKGKADWQTARLGGSWEHPIDLLVAYHQDGKLRMPMLNLPNQGYLPDLPSGRVVEGPVVAGGGAVTGAAVGPLPGQTGALCRAVSDVHELVAEGAATGDRDALARAIAIDPAIPAKADAQHVLDQMLAAHADLLPRFA
jgi:alpha-galactosidase